MPRPASGSHHGTAPTAYDGEAVVASIGSSPTTPSAPNTSAPAVSPAAARATGGSPGRSLAASTKYEAHPTIAHSAQNTPSGAKSAPDSRSRTSTRPSAARPAPATVSGRGRSPRRSHSQTTTAAGAVYSISSAGPTSIRWTAEK